MRQIPLRDKNGGVHGHALVDDEDFDLVSRHNWFLHTNGYVVANILHPMGGRRKTGAGRRKTSLRMHRLLLGLPLGDPRDGDHINGDRLDHRRHNLRVATKAQNNQNVPARGRSAYRGVSWHRQRGKWRARAKLCGIEHSLGYFDDEREAGRVASEWRIANMPYAVESYDG